LEIYNVLIQLNKSVIYNSLVYKIMVYILKYGLTKFQIYNFEIYNLYKSMAEAPKINSNISKWLLFENEK